MPTLASWLQNHEITGHIIQSLEFLEFHAHVYHNQLVRMTCIAYTEYKKEYMNHQMFRLKMLAKDEVENVGRKFIST